MSKPLAIQVKGLGKEYMLGGVERADETFREMLMGSLTAPFRRLKRLRGDVVESERFWALKDISFEVESGEVVGVIGRNGAGKSTLLKILSRITDPTEGRVEIRGRVSSLLEVGTGFHPELTGRENIFLNGAILGMTRCEIRKKFDEIVAFSEVEKFLDTPVKRYSSGMYMRLAFAVAAHLEPEILVVDEVLAVGDAAFQKKCLGKMSDVAKEGRTVLFVSHNLNAVESLCSSILLLDKGRLVTRGDDVRSVIRQYLHADGETVHTPEWNNTDGRVHSDPLFSPVKLSICCEDGKLSQMPVRNDDSLWVYVEFDAELTNPLLKVGYAVFDEEGSLLYFTFQTDLSEESWPKVCKGRNLFRSRLPSRLLNEGTYRIEMIAAVHREKWFLQPGVSSASVSLCIQGGVSDSPYWRAKRNGKLAVNIQWESTA